MKLNKKLSPYPILLNGDDDYIDSSFDTEVTYKQLISRIDIDSKFILNNDGIQKLIDEGDAIFTLHVECSYTQYRNIFQTSKPTFMLSLNSNDFEKVIEVTPLIISIKDITNYYNESFNWDYGTDGFDIEKGSILAISSNRITIKLQDNKERLKKIPDIIKITQNDTIQHNEMTVNLDNNFISINVSADVKNLYATKGNRFKNNIISQVLVPSMSYTLLQMKNNADNYSEYEWFSVITNTLKQMGVDLQNISSESSDRQNDIFNISQSIFNYPLKKGLEELDLIHLEDADND